MAIENFKPGYHCWISYTQRLSGYECSKKASLPFIYYWVDVYHTQIPVKYPINHWEYIFEKKALSSADQVVRSIS